MTFDRICGNCGAAISSEHDSCPKCPPLKPVKKAEAVPALLVIAVLCSSLLMLGTSVVNVVNLPNVEKAKPSVEMGDRKGAAYTAAIAFIEERFPGKRQFAELYQSVVAEEGNRFMVTVSAQDAEGGSGAREVFKVELELSGDQWVLKEIKR